MCRYGTFYVRAGGALFCGQVRTGALCMQYATNMHRTTEPRECERVLYSCARTSVSERDSIIYKTAAAAANPPPHHHNNRHHHPVSTTVCARCARIRE